MPLTDIACRKATCPPDKARERLAEGHGMYLEVMLSGAKYWRLKYRFGAKENRLALGVYPEVSLAEARGARDRQEGASRRPESRSKAQGRQARPADQCRRLLRGGRPRLARAMEVVADGPTDHHTEYVIRRLAADVFPILGPFARRRGLTAPKLVLMAKRIEARGEIDIAKRALQTCGQILRFAVAHGALERMGYKHRMTGHGFRGIASTLLHELSFPHAHIELQLAHQERNAASASYNHATYLPERRMMMQAWADHLDALRTGNRAKPLGQRKPSPGNAGSR